MRIISVQTIAGGTGVTTIATEIIDEWLSDGKRVLALDFGHNQMLGGMLAGKGFKVLGDAGTLFRADIAWQRQEPISFTHRCIMALGDEYAVYNQCSEEALLGKDGHQSLEDAKQHFLKQLQWLSHCFDVCVVDLSKAPHHLKVMFAELSDEIRFCERPTLRDATWEKFHDAFLRHVKCKEDQIWMKYADRAAMSPKVIETSPGLSF